VAFFFVTGPAALESRWFARGTAVSHLLLTHEPWRAVTALTLHADSVHVLGNAISGTIFGALVNRRLGAGGAALAILGGGALGNFGNAVWHQAKGEGGHQSIGASTAVFAAIGILAVTQMAVDRPEEPSSDREPGAKLRRVLDFAGPLVGGFALLGALGAGGATTDLGAHLYGLLAGGLIGGIASLFLRRKHQMGVTFGRAGVHHQVALGSGAPNPALQAVCGALAAALVAVSWIIALRS
jgi:membrane associated rhomboid family serine protease